jgi:cbb3-type cytochrome oxidase subunit 3
VPQKSTPVVVTSVDELKKLTKEGEVVLQSLATESNSGSSYSVNETSPCGKSPTCSGRGTCRDKVCICRDANFTGKFCQYDAVTFAQVSILSDFILTSIYESFNKQANEGKNFIHSKESTQEIVDQVATRAAIPELNTGDNLKRSVSIIQDMSTNPNFEMNLDTVINSFNAVGFLYYATRYFDNTTDNITKAQITSGLVESSNQLMPRLITQLETIGNPMSLDQKYKNFTGFDMLMLKTDTSTDLKKEPSIGFNNWVITLPINFTKNQTAKLASGNDFTLLVSKIWEENPFIFISNITTLSTVISVNSFLKESAKTASSVEVKDLDEPIRLMFKNADANQPTSCVYWNGTGWDTKGINTTVFTGNSSVVCETNHLSEFTLIRKIEQNNSSREEEKLTTTAIVLISLGVFFIVIIVIATIVYIYKKRKEASNYEKPGNYLKEMEVESQFGLNKSRV